MNESRTIRVLKRDGRVEPFDRAKLTGAMFRAMRGTHATYLHARSLAEAIEMFLRRRGKWFISSSAVFEMTIRVLRGVQLRSTAKVLDAHRSKRAIWRKGAAVIHPTGNVTAWDTSWLATLTETSWHVSPRTGRIVAAAIEHQLRRANRTRMRRDEIVDLVNDYIEAFGLADAVPVA